MVIHGIQVYFYSDLQDLFSSIWWTKRFIFIYMEIHKIQFYFYCDLQVLFFTYMVTKKI